MPFGISDTGFELKRLQDILRTNRESAVSIFQDLLEPTDVVDTSDSSTLGRLINMFSLPESVLWEQLQLAYSALDPNTAIGVALDNIVQYGGLSRRSPEKSNVQVLFYGTIGTTIGSGSIIGSSQFKDLFEVTTPVSISPTVCAGIAVSVTPQNSTDYTISYNNSLGVTEVITYHSSSSATTGEIYAGLLSVITTLHPYLTAEISEGLLKIKKVNYFQPSTFTSSANVSIEKAFKVSLIFAKEVGVVHAPANSLTIIKTPILGWDTVTNVLAATEGRLVESDVELRLRFENTKFDKSTNILDALYSALDNIEGVENVAVYDNDSNVTDGNGLPPHSVSAIVLGGDENVIAETIWQNKPYGIPTYGNTSVNIVDSQGFTRAINFKRPTPIYIYVKVDITTAPDFPADGVDQIKGDIIQYAKDNFTVGEDVVYSRLYTPINQVKGHQINSLKIGLSPSPTGTSNIAIAFDEISQFTSANISIIVS